MNKIKEFYILTSDDLTDDDAFVMAKYRFKMQSCVGAHRNWNYFTREISQANQDANTEIKKIFEGNMR